MKRLLYILFFGNITGMYGQAGANPSPVSNSIDMYPKTPDAAALSKFVDIPAGSYTGVADFTIPLYTIELDGEKIPIELKYTTTGVTVGQTATRVGLGWVLNTGPSLSQQVVGIQDMVYPRPVIQGNISPNASNDTPGSDYDIALVASGLRKDNGLIDLKPDIFTYSLLKKNGKFIMNPTGAYGIPMPYNQIKITRPSAHQMNLTDEEGVSYNFQGSFVSTQTRNTCSQPDAEFVYKDPNYKITSIKSPKNQEVKFLYGNTVISKFIPSITTQERVNITGFYPSGPPTYMAFQNKCINYTDLHDNPLSEIQFKGGKILFSYSDTNQRLDLDGEVYLTNVIIKNDQNEIIKNFTLSYDYFTSLSSALPVELTGPYIAPYNKGLDKRLKLTTVTDNLANGIYKLEYFETEPGTGKKLPIRVSNNQDFWGVYNGKENLNKSISLSKYEDINIQSPYIGADKTPDITFGRLGNLKKIAYPTGGFSNIEYEADDFDISDNPIIIYDYSFQNFPHPADDTIYPPVKIPIIIPANAINKTLNFTGRQNLPPGNIYGPCYWNLKKPNGTIETGKLSGSFSRNDLPGNYEIWIERDETFPNVKCDVNYSFDTEVATPIETIYTQPVGTIRVSKIESIDNSGGKIVRKYSYKEPTTNHVLPYTKSSGVNLGEELFISLSTQKYPLDAQGHYATEQIVSNNPGWQTSTMRGKAIGYSYVQEYYIDEITPSNSYRKEYKFINDPEPQYHDPSSAINVTWFVSDFDKGLVKEEKLFNSSNKIVKKVINEYQYDGYFNSRYSNYTMDAKSMGFGLEIIPTIINNGNVTFDHTTFKLKNEWVSEKKSIHTDYSAVGDSLVVENITNYSIPGYVHTFPKESLTTNSLGETLKSVFKYPQDITMVNPQYGSMQKLISKNQISDPVITKSYTDNLVTSEIRTLYDQFNTGNDEMTLPQFIYVKKGEDATADDRRITYNSYDTQGNLTQYMLESGIPVSVIWGYNKTFPILKIEGAVYEDIKDLSIITDVIAAAENDNALIQGQTADQTEASLITALDAVRMNNSLKDYQITTYSYDPLVGVRSVTPPSGMREVYTYDNAKRLKEVKRMELDANGNAVYKTLKANEYHYQQ